MFLQHLMHDQIGVADDGVHVANGGEISRTLALLHSRPIGSSIRRLTAMTSSNGWSSNRSNSALNERVQIPKLVSLDQVGVVIGQDEIRVVLEKQIGHVVQARQAVSSGDPRPRSWHNW